LRSVLLFFLFCFSGAFAQTEVTVSGNVKSSENKNLAGADISFQSDNQMLHSFTDTLGNFSANLKPGLVKMSIANFGYVEKHLSFDLKKDTVISIAMENDNSLLEEVTVAGQKRKPISSLAGGKLVFNMKDLSSIPSASGTTDIIKLLQLTPGVQNSGDANGYLYVRGGDPGHNAILFGGTTVYGMSHLLGIFPFYNANHIQEVEFDKSSSNAKYGGRLSSTTLLISNKKIPSQFTAQGSVGLLASQLTLAVPLGEKTGLFVSGRKTYIDQIVAPLLKSKVDKNSPQSMKYGFSDGNLTFISQISKRNSLTVDAFLSGDELRISDPYFALSSSLKWSNFTVSPTVLTRFSAKTSMSNAVYYTQYTNDLSMDQASVQMRVSSYIKDYGFSNSVRFMVKEIPFESGLQYVYHDLQPQKIEVSNLSTDVPKNDLMKANECAVFTTARPRLWKNLTAELGLRLNYYSSGKSTSYLNLQPRAVLNYFVDNNLSFYATYSRQNQYINLITTSSVCIPTDFWVASTNGIPAQSSDEIAIGSNHSFFKNITSSLGAFYRSMNNLLEYPYGVTRFNEMSSLEKDMLVGRGKAYGLETMLRKDAGKFKGWLSYTLSWSDRTFAELNNGNTFYAKYDRRHNLSLVGVYDLNSKWNFGITQIFSSGNRFTMPTSWYFINNNPVKEYSAYNNAQMPNYIRTDISVNYFFVKNSKKESALNFSVYNTFNIANPTYVVLNIYTNNNSTGGDNVIMKAENKVLYKILPSISWRFKF